MFSKTKEVISLRDFLLKSTVASGVLLTGRDSGAAQSEGPVAAVKSDSDVGSLFPIIQAQAVKGEFPLSFLNSKFRNVQRWKKEARGKLLELLHYSPEKCEPRAELVEKVDMGDYVREKIFFNTTPVIRVPAYVLAPKREGKRPAIVALHDHGGFYLWGKEKLVAVEGKRRS
jgi:hypothetical protein